MIVSEGKDVAGRPVKLVWNPTFTWKAFHLEGGQGPAGGRMSLGAAVGAWNKRATTRLTVSEVSSRIAQTAQKSN